MTTIDFDSANKIIDDGYVIANKIAAAKTLDELDKLSPEIDAYGDILDNTFGTLNDFDEMDSSVGMSLYVALDWKRSSLYPENKNNPATKHLAERFMEDFLDELEWQLERPMVIKKAPDSSSDASPKA